MVAVDILEYFHSERETNAVAKQMLKERQKYLTKVRNDWLLKRYLLLEVGPLKKYLLVLTVNL